MTLASEDILINGLDGEFSAYVAIPRRPSGLAVVMLQEIFGVNANIRALADSFAAAGHAVVAPDLFWRQAPGIQLDPAKEDDRSRAMELMQGLNRDQSVADAAAALTTLRARVPGLENAAAVGYCYGGSVAYLLAARGVVDAGVAYYGTGLHTILAELEGLKGRLLLHIAAEDYICPPEAQQAIAEAVEKIGDRAVVMTHPGVGHAFARVGGSAFDQQAADRANAATKELLESLAVSA